MGATGTAQAGAGGRKRLTAEERERAKAEKAEEKERAKAAKAAERERAKAAKEAEKEAKKAAKVRCCGDVGRAVDAWRSFAPGCSP